MYVKRGALIVFLIALCIPYLTFSQCTHCSTPAAPANMTYSGSGTYYQGAIIQLWIVPPTVAVDGYEWYKVVGTDTTLIGYTDTMSYTADVTCSFLARSKNICTCVGTTTTSNYYSAYSLMASITVVNVSNFPTDKVSNNVQTVCSGMPTNIIISSNSTYYNTYWTRSNTSNVSGTASGVPYNGGVIPVTLTNNTSTAQTVRFMFHMGTVYNSAWTNSNCSSFYVTVLPSAAPTPNDCYAPPVPHHLLSSGGAYAMTYYKGAQTQILADTTILADSLLWYRVKGTDTSYAGHGYSINVTIDTTCLYIARNANVCNCSTHSVYYSAWFPMASFTVNSSSYTIPNFGIANNMPSIASGTQIDLVPSIDSSTFSNFALYMDNAYVSGTKSASSSVLSVFSITLTNTTSVPQLVRYWFLSTNNTAFGNTVSGYITVLPSTSTAPSGNHCSVPLMVNNTYQAILGAPSSICYVKGATVNLDLNHVNSAPFNTSSVNADSVAWYKVRWPGDTTYLGSSYPVNTLMDTSCMIYTISKNICYWSDSSKHIYTSAKSRVLNASVANGTNPTVTLTNNVPFLCNAQSTNIQVSSASGNTVIWLRDNAPKITGALTGNLYYTFPATISTTLTDTISIPQQVNFEAVSSTTISGKTCWGSSALTSVVTYPSCSKWANNTIAVHPSNDSICAGGTATLTADTLPCSGGTKYRWSSGDTIQSINKTAAGTYTVTATNYCGCSVTAIALVAIRPNPTPVSGNARICQGTTATLSVTGGARYLWSRGDSTSSITTSGAGIYTVTITNGSGCTATLNDTVSVISFPPPAISVNHSRDNAKGAINVTLSGGNPPYRFTWDDIPVLLGVDSANLTDSVLGFNVYASLGTLGSRSGIDTGWYHLVISDSLCSRGDSMIHVGTESNWMYATGIYTSNDNSRDSSGGYSNYGLLTRIDTSSVWNKGAFVGYRHLNPGQKGEFEITGLTQVDSLEQYGGISALDSAYMSALTDPGNPVNTFSTANKYLFYFKNTSYYILDQDGMSASLGDYRSHSDFKVCSTGSQIKYVVDGVVIKTVSAQQLPLYGGGGILKNGGSFKARFVTY